RVDAVRPRDDRQQEGEVLDEAGHRPEAEEVEHPRLASGGPDARLGDEAGGRPDADDAAVVGGDADRAAAVRADPGGGGVGAEQGSLAAARAAWRSPRVER